MPKRKKPKPRAPRRRPFVGGSVAQDVLEGLEAAHRKVCERSTTPPPFSRTLETVLRLGLASLPAEAP